LTVRLKLFAAARDLAGRDVLELELPDDATVAMLRRELTSRVPALAPLAPHLMFAVNQQYAGNDATIPPDAEVACIPPVSGG
jgi:molybdopterin converting factor subunit 1